MNDSEKKVEVGNPEMTEQNLERQRKAQQERMDAAIAAGGRRIVTASGDGEFVIEGFPYKGELWQKVSEQMRALGNKFSIYFPDDDSDLFFKTADSIDQLIDLIALRNKESGTLPVDED